MISVLCLAAFAQDPVAATTPTDEDTLALPDRSKAPDVRPPEPLKLDDLERHELKPGLEVWHVRVPRVRQVRVELIWWQGGYVDLSPKAYDPAIGLVGSLWDVASETYDGDQLSVLGDTLELGVLASVGDHQSSVELNVPLEDLTLGLDVLADVVMHPTFPKRELKLNKENAERWWDVLGPTSPSSVAESALSYSWNAADHPYGWRTDPDAYLAVKPKELLAAHQRLISTGPVSILVVGDVDWATIEPELRSRFGELGAPGERARAIDAPMPNATRVLAIDMPKSEQALIRMRLPGPGRSHADRAGLSAASWALGGHFLARLNKNLREDKGWTYGVRAGYGAGEKRGSFSVAVDVPADKLAPAVTEIQRELSAVATGGANPDELASWWRASVADYNSTRGTSDTAYGFYYGLLDWEEGVEDQLAWLERIQATTPEVSTEVAGRWLGESAPRVWVVAGPRSALEPAFAELGWEAEWILPKDAILGRFPGGPQLR
jgi:zinc protease